MRKLFVYFFFFIICLNISFALSVDPSHSSIQYMGRWNFDDPSQPWVAWKGSAVKIKFSGTGITGEFDAGSSNEQYRIIIDGVPNADTTTFSWKKSTYTLASSLSDGEHTVEVMKETFNNNNTTFYGFEITGSSPAILPLPPKPSMRIEFFGDSNMDGSSLYSEQDQGDHGSYYAYPAVVSRMLNAEHNDQSVGGATIDGNGDNDVRSFIVSQDYYNQGYTPTFNPQVIVINAGANDIYGANKNTIKNRYKTVITDLRTVYGASPHIVLFNAYGWDPDEPAEYTHEVVTELAATGETNVSVCLFPWMWEQWHGSMVILSLGLGFTQVQDAEIFNPFGLGFDVVNGSFENKAIGGFDAFGWRYFNDPGVNRVYDPAVAPDGDYYLSLTHNTGGTYWGSVHQGTDATGDLLPGALAATQDYYVTLMMKGTSGAQAEISAEHQQQAVYDGGVTGIDAQTVDVTANWAEYTVHLTAPSGTWKNRIRLRATSGTVNFDAVSMSDTLPPVPCQDGGDCDLSDLLAMLNQWLSTDSQWDIAPDPGDGQVDFLDFAALSQQWNP
ncbi:MAG: GDSL-type esterase/lipase family protein [Planctomycetota bacterium]|jgi:lysophospholipase L1-like esterase